MTDYVGTILGSRSYSYSGCNYNSGNYNYNVASSSQLNRIANDIASGYSSKIDIVNLYVEQGDVDKALALYDQLFNSAEKTAQGYGFELQKSQVESIVDQAFLKRTGTTLSGSINANTSSSAATGLINGIPVIGWFFTQHDSDADALAKLSGTKVSAKATATECACGAVSGVASGAAIGAAIGTAIGGWAFGAGTLIGAGIGAAVGGIAGLLRGLF